MEFIRIASVFIGFLVPNHKKPGGPGCQWGVVGVLRYTSDSRHIGSSQASS